MLLALWSGFWDWGGAKEVDNGWLGGGLFQQKSIAKKIDKVEWLKNALGQENDETLKPVLKEVVNYAPNRSAVIAQLFEIQQKDLDIDALKRELNLIKAFLVAEQERLFMLARQRDDELAILLLM